jgi:magnesium transporter
VRPTDDDLALLRRSLALPPEVLRHAIDVDELARVDHEKDGTDLIVLRVPWHREDDSGLPCRAASFAIILRGGLFLTIAPGPDEIATDVIARGAVPVADPALLLVSLLMCAAERFLSSLRMIDSAVGVLEDSLREAQANQAVFGLLNYQKALVHLTTALSTNQIMLERLQQNERPRFSPEAHELLGDALVELRQAAVMTQVSSDILSQMVDAFASIISNNLNVVMKLLTVLSTGLAVPMLIATVYGMNVALPGQHGPHAFGWLVALSALLSGLFVWTLLRKHLL